MPSSSEPLSRSAKRRKIDGHRSVSTSAEPFLPELFDGREDKELAKYRYRMYSDLWAAQEKKLQVKLCLKAENTMLISNRMS